MAKWLVYKDVHAVYHSHLSPLLRLVAQLGCTCHVSRGVPRRSPHEGFALHELRPSAHQDTYLSAGPAPDATDADGSGAAGVGSLAAASLAGGFKKIAIYAAGGTSRGVLSVIAAHDGTGVMILVRPRGVATAPDARAVLTSHRVAVELAAAGNGLTIETADSWETAYGKLQKLLPSLQSAAKGPLVALAQTRHTPAALHKLAPALMQMPLLAVAHNGADDALRDDGSLQLGGAWQAVALEMALDRFDELGGWFESRLEIARYAGVPIGCLPADAAAFSCDIMLHRRLLSAGHLSWLSPSPTPDLGGHPALSTDGGGAEELVSPEVKRACRPERRPFRRPLIHVLDSSS